ncbi:hypothetical protein, partial [Salmonella enterica]|uniref:hypothetical protein n=2 Tax=Enterobacteriaceae TaxID=543 RepID=UPI003527C58C
IGVTYADGKHMRMFALCRCVAYGYAAHILFSHFFTADPKKASSGSDSAPPARSGPETQDVAVFPAVSDHICCAPPLPRDRPLTTLKGRCGYSVCVVHFRKLWNNIKVGSGQSGRQVI